MKQAVIILVLLLCSCRAKKEVFTSETKVIDSIMIKSEVIKAPVLNDLLVIEQLCDSITDRPVQFRKVYVINGDSIEVLTNEKNQLVFRLNQREKIIYSKDSLIRKLQKELREKSESVVYKNNWKIIAWAFFIGLALGIVIMVWKPWKPLLARIRLKQ